MNIPNQDISLRMHEWQNLSLTEAEIATGPIALSDADLRLTEALSDSRFLKILNLKTGLDIRTTSYVGRITIGPVQLHIAPKLEKLPLLSLFRYAYGLNKLHLFDQATIQTEDAGLVELLILQLIAEVKELIQRGLAKRYVDQQCYLAQPKGRLDISRIAREGLHQDGRLPCRIHPRLTDIPHNQCIRAGLVLGARLTIDKQLAFNCHQLSRLLDLAVSEIQLSRAFFDVLDRSHGRLLRHYEPALKLCRLLMQSYGIALDSVDSELSVPGFLFDMNRLYQNVLGRFLRENLPDCEVLEEHALRGMFSYAADFNPRNRSAPLPRPDFIIRRQDQTSQVLDAKYRDLWEQTLPREMLYQLGMYALAHPKVGGATILYPTMSRYAREARISIYEPISGRWMSEVRMRPVYLPDLVGWIESPTSVSYRRGGQRYAESLAFGVMDENLVDTAKMVGVKSEKGSNL